LALAQIQQAWLATYNNGLTNGTHQALFMKLDLKQARCKPRVTGAVFFGENSLGRS